MIKAGFFPYHLNRQHWCFSAELPCSVGRGWALPSFPPMELQGEEMLHVPVLAMEQPPASPSSSMMGCVAHVGPVGG